MSSTPIASAATIPEFKRALSRFATGVTVMFATGVDPRHRTGRRTAPGSG